MLFSWKTAPTTVIMIRMFIVLFRDNSSSKSNLIFICFSSPSSEFLVIDLIKSLILLQILHIFYYFFTSIKRHYRKILIFINLFKVSIHFADNKVQKTYTINFYIFRIFYSHIPNVVNKNNFVWLFTCSSFIWIKILHIDNIVEFITRFFQFILSI